MTDRFLKVELLLLDLKPAVFFFAEFLLERPRNIDIPNAKITLEVSDEVLAERKAKYVAPEPNIKTGWLSRYARMVTSANLGAVLK